jgi:hypothetical protein
MMPNLAARRARALVELVRQLQAGRCEGEWREVQVERPIAPHLSVLCVLSCCDVCARERACACAHIQYRAIVSFHRC